MLFKVFQVSDDPITVSIGGMEVGAMLDEPVEQCLLAKLGDLEQYGCAELVLGI